MADVQTTEAEMLKQQYPGFTITCDNCQSTRVRLDDNRGYSPDSGAWGSVDLVCLDCPNSVELVST
jgi:ssDNA-binding Zn-finger/Zn-ribbon topoisomerase 1